MKVKVDEFRLRTGQRVTVEIDTDVVVSRLKEEVCVKGRKVEDVLKETGWYRYVDKLKKWIEEGTKCG